MKNNGLPILNLIVYNRRSNLIIKFLNWSEKNKLIKIKNASSLVTVHKLIIIIFESVIKDKIFEWMKWRYLYKNLLELNTG